MPRFRRSDALRFQISISGDVELDRIFRGFEPRLQKKMIRQVLRKAARPVYNAARAKVPVRTGLLKNSIRIRAAKKSRRRRNQIGIAVGPQATYFKGKQFYAGYVEYGTPRHKFRGVLTPIEARPFMRPALDESASEVRQIFQREVRLAIEQTAKERKG